MLAAKAIPRRSFYLWRRQFDAYVLTSRGYPALPRKIDSNEILKSISAEKKQTLIAIYRLDNQHKPLLLLDVAIDEHNFKIVSMPKEKLLLIGITLSLSRKNEFISFLNFALENQCDQICQNFANFAKISPILPKLKKSWAIFERIILYSGTFWNCLGKLWHTM